MIFGKRLDRDEAGRLWDLDLLTLGAAADRVRRRLNPGNRVTFVIDRDGKVRHVVPVQHARGHAAEILKLVKEMK